MSIVDLTGRPKEVEEAFKEAPTLLQQDEKLYLTENESDEQRNKRETKKSGGARGGGIGKGRGQGDSSSARSSNKSADRRQVSTLRQDEHWTRECHLKPKKK
jgi:hypothetical protein